MGQFVQLEQQEMHRQNRDLVAVREVDPFECRVSFRQCIYGFVREIIHAHETNATKFGQSGEFKHGHIR
jgi:hypothetical protein